MSLHRAPATFAQPAHLQWALILIGWCVLYLPTYQTLDQVVWVRPGQGHGPLMLALICYLIWQRWASFWELPEDNRRGAAISVGLFSSALYVLGRSQDVMVLDTFSQITTLAALVLWFRGWKGLRHLWLPLFFFIFVIPLPTTFVDAATAPLKTAVSQVAAALLFEAGYPVGRQGVMLVIGPYKLLVADACAGLNSIFSLEAIGVFYMGMMGYTSRVRNALIAAVILPISFLSNVLRVCALVLITYYFGDEVGQGFVHDFAGIFLFVIATVLTIWFDKLIGVFFKGDKTTRAPA